MRIALFALSLPVLAALAVLAEDGNASLLPEGAGKPLVARACTECHSVDRMRSLRVSRDAWEEKIADMVDRGAKLTDAESDAVAAYLTAEFGPDSPIRINTAPMIEIKSVFGFTAAEAQALVAYRTAHGAFKEWKDLAAVPGIDIKKLEARRAKIVF